MFNKYMAEKILAEYAEKLEKENKEFTLKGFFKKFNESGNIPIDLVKFEILDNNFEALGDYIKLNA